VFTDNQISSGALTSYIDRRYFL